MAAANAPIVNSQNFGNNAFSNFAPLLTLFGDELTKQFLSTSMGWADNLLLGIAPIGIMTIIISSIRVSGNRLLKSLIGRARDSPDEEEKELLSSVSPNVREIWDGGRVLRETGESKTVALVHYPNSEDNSPLRILDLKMSGCTVAGEEVDEPESTDNNTSQHTDEIPSDPAPNLTLNIDKAVPDRWEVNISVCFGLLIQAAVMAINAIAVYNWHWLRAGSVVAPYGYPVWATGTISVGLGVTICAQVVEGSTTKYTVCPGTGDKRLRIIMLQREITDLHLPAYAIIKDTKNPFVRVSRRVWPPTHVDQPRTERMKIILLTVLGTFLALGGFICQNIGTRELHWSAGVLQLGATLVLTALRAWLRRHVGDPPRPTPLKLLNGAGASDLASHLEEHSCYVFGHFGDLYYLRQTDRPGCSKRFPVLNKQKDVEKFIHEKDTKNNCHARIMRRILAAQAELAKHQPDKDEVVNLASGLCDAMNESLKIVFGNKPPSFKDSVRIYMKVADSAIIPFRFPEGPETPSTRHTIQAMISLTCYEYAKNPPPKSIFRMLGDLISKRDLLHSWIGEAAKIGTWKSEETENHAPRSGTCIVFGLPLIFCFEDIDENEDDDEDEDGGRDDIIEDILPNLIDDTYSIDDNVQAILNDVGFDLFCEPHRRASLEENIALDLFSSFIFGVSTHSLDAFNQFMREAEGHGCDKLADMLVKHNVCRSSKEGRMAIAPPLIAQGILKDPPPGYSSPPPTARDDFATGIVVMDD